MGFLCPHSVRTYDGLECDELRAVEIYSGGFMMLAGNSGCGFQLPLKRSLDE